MSKLTMKQRNHARAVLKVGEKPRLGFWQMLPGATLLRCLATSGCDRVMLDLEHGNIDGNRALIHEANKTP